MAEPVVIGILYPEAFVAEGVFDDAVALFKSVDPRVEVIVEEYHEGHDSRTARGKGARVELPPLTPAQKAMFERIEVALTLDLPYDIGKIAPKLRWVQAVGAGTAQLQTAGLDEAGIVLTSNAGSNSVGIAEFVVGRIIAAYKDFRAIEANQAQALWQPVYGDEMAGMTVGMLGVGAINEAVAQRLKAFDMTILATRRSVGGELPPYVDEVYQTSDLHSMLPRCDVVVAAVPETAETNGLMNTASFAKMKPGSFFVNVGRGGLVDEPALINALESGHLKGAAIDVAILEPLPSDNPLWKAPNIFISPHCSTAPKALFRNLHTKFAANLKRYLAGEPLRNVVDASRGY